MSVLKYHIKILLICGSLLLAGCSGNKDYTEKENIADYNCYSYYLNSNVDVTNDVTEILLINSQREIDDYVSDTEKLCRTLRNFLENKKFYSDIDVGIKSVSVDSECFKNIETDYKDFKTIKYIVNATIYTEFEISDALVYVTYSEGNIVKFEYIGI